MNISYCESCGRDARAEDHHDDCPEVNHLPVEAWNRGPEPGADLLLWD